MSKSIILKMDPKIEFQLLDDGFNLDDAQTEINSGFYTYDDLQSIELDKPWFPKLAKFLRHFTWILNGVPYFPDGESYKKAKLVFHFRNTKLGIWLTDTHMAKEAKKLEQLLDVKLNVSGNNE